MARDEDLKSPVNDSPNGVQTDHDIEELRATEAASAVMQYLDENGVKMLGGGFAWWDIHDAVRVILTTRFPIEKGS